MNPRKQFCLNTEPTHEYFKEIFQRIELMWKINNGCSMKANPKKKMKFRGTFSPFELARDLVSPTPKALPQRLSVCSKLIYFSSFNPKRTIQPSILTNREKAWKNNIAEMQNSIVQFNRTQKSRCYKKCFDIYLACFNFHLISFNRVDHGVSWLKKS